MPRTPLPLVLLAALACAPDTPQIRAQVPEIGVAPDPLAFGDQAVPLPAEARFFVSNAGRAELTFQLALEDDADGVFVLPVTEGSVSAGDSLPMAVRFTPTTYLDYTANLVITSNDEDTPELVLAVTGTGVAAPLPDILVDPLSIDFGDVPAERTEIVTVRNTGTAPLSLGTLRQVGSPSFTLLTDPSGNTIAPGDDVPIVIRYAPTSTDGDSGSLVVPSDDPDEAEVEVLLLGNGGADYAYPEAVIDCPGPVDPPGFVTLEGYDSFDPEGHTPLSYAWSLVAVPTDSTGAPVSSGYLTNDVSESTALWADAVGTYEVELSVTNSIGVRSAPTRCLVDAIPDEELLIELTWSTSNADLDLHLAQAGNALFSRPGDATWCNRSPSWGASGTADDPRLDLDDRAGHGPENISIDAPADGTYDVRVHYFEDQGDDVVTATVRVYVLGDLAFQASQNLSRNEVWDAARVNWPAGTVGALSAPVYAATHRQCY
ncbi:MAG: choice-of-anchor D domain-containing protein [Alphaproteobacteria bacterium]|nr:choice-of-anchor D domain-containing protein [Alphaproteobacteria bacterium]